jgi:hypothetical protein
VEGGRGLMLKKGFTVGALLLIPIPIRFFVGALVFIMACAI